MDLLLSAWAARMRADCDAAGDSITISALSCQPPKTKTPGQWPALWESWIQAAARGVRVTLLLPKPSNQHGATVSNGRTAEHAAKCDIRTHLIPGPRLLHCKSLIVDKRILYIGSGNFTSAAAHHNYEAYIRVDSEPLAAQLMNQWGPLCR